MSPRLSYPWEGVLGPDVTGLDPGPPVFVSGEPDVEPVDSVDVENGQGCAYQDPDTDEYVCRTNLATHRVGGYPYCADHVADGGAADDLRRYRARHGALR